MPYFVSADVTTAPVGEEEAVNGDTQPACPSVPLPRDASPHPVSAALVLDMTGGVYPGLEPESPSRKMPPASSTLTDEELTAGSWQRGKSVLACNRHMLENQLACDVWFRVGGSGERVGAHRYVLQSRSGVFFAMFDEPEVGLVDIPLPDTCPKIFWQFLRCVYYEELHPDGDSVFGLLRLAEDYDVGAALTVCLRFLKNCLTDHRVCDILEIAHRHDDRQLYAEAMAYIRRHGEDVVVTAAMDVLCRECLNKVLTMDGLDLNPTVREEVSDRWARRQCEKKDCEPTADNKQESLGDVIYVKRDDATSHRYVLGSVTERHLSRQDPKKAESPPPSYTQLSPTVSRSDLGDVDNLSLTSASSLGTQRSLKSLCSRTPSTATWPDLNHVTRFRETDGELASEGKADAVSFTVNRSVSLYGFGIYGSARPGEAAFRVDTIVTRKKKDVVMESIAIKGAGMILPVMFERPVRLERDKPYTLEIYVHGPPCHCGTHALTSVTEGTATFTFSRAPAAVKGNRTSVRKGQIPRLYFVPL